MRILQYIINANYDRLIENIGIDEGGVYHGIHEENGLLMENFLEIMFLQYLKT